MVARRLAPEGSQSPPAIQGYSSGSAPDTRRTSTIDETDGKLRTFLVCRLSHLPMLDPKSSRKSTPGQSARGAKGRFTGKSQLKEASSAVVVKGRPGKTKQDPKKNNQGPEEDDGDEANAAIPKAAPKAAAKPPAAKSNRRKSVRKR